MEREGIHVNDIHREQEGSGLRLSSIDQRTVTFAFDLRDSPESKRQSPEAQNRAIRLL